MSKKSFEGKGTVEILKYKSINLPLKDIKKLVVKIILSFTPDNSLGKEGDSISFVQMVSDNYYHTNKDNVTEYTWKQNTGAKFQKRAKVLYEGDPELRGIIDQDISGNCDFRYPEQREKESDPLSSEERKINQVCEWTEEELKKNEMTILSGLSTKTEKEAKIKQHLYNKEQILPHLAYSTTKQSNGWKPARMADTPTTWFGNHDIEVGGGQDFETVVIYETGEKMEAICTVKWGWNVEKSEKHGYVARTKDIEIVEGCSLEFKKACEDWNKLKKENEFAKLFRIPEIE